MRLPRRLSDLTIAGTLLLALGSLTACGDDTDAAAEPAAAQTASNGDVLNDADVAFATDMIPHHAQAIEMVTLTDGRGLGPDLTRIANEIREAQGPEVETMVDWLTAWDREVPATSLDHANAEGHGGDEGMDMSGDMPGMMSEDEMSALAAAPDGEFEDLWLQMMIEHHTGAIEMAKTEATDGTYVDAVALAESIRVSQQAEIDEMQGMLDT